MDDGLPLFSAEDSDIFSRASNSSIPYGGVLTASLNVVEKASIKKNHEFASFHTLLLSYTYL